MRMDSLCNQMMDININCKLCNSCSQEDICDDCLLGVCSNCSTMIYKFNGHVNGYMCYECFHMYCEVCCQQTMKSPNYCKQC